MFLQHFFLSPVHAYITLCQFFYIIESVLHPPKIKNAEHRKLEVAVIFGQGKKPIICKKKKKIISLRKILKGSETIS